MSTDYAELGRQLRGLLGAEADPLANCANFVGLVYHALPDINWLGIYVVRGSELVLGPFQGKPACVRIPFGTGVCGTAAASRQILRVADVNQFAGHIACDAASRSEIVLPLIRRERLLGVLDVDSPHIDRFSVSDQAGLAMLCEVLVERLHDSSATGFI